ncbi:MAG TPA: F0F1 ATP synthase subunit A [Dehalococcoidia bacterium]|nr:F0F1 ATP synthase subunit A [Dehalococcoidia bacterium]
MKRLVIIGALLYLVASIGVSIFVIKPPKPIIEIHGEPLIHIAGKSGSIFDFSITNTLLTAWICAILLILICVVITRHKSLVPSGWYNFLEALIEVIDNFVTSIAGQKNGRRFFPLIATLFIYIGFANWISLVPIFNTIGGYVPLNSQETHFSEHAVVFNGGGLKLVNLGADFVTIDAADCATGSEGDACRQEAIDTASQEHTSGGEHLGLLYPFLRGVNTDLMTPLAFALVAMAMIQYWGMTTLGPLRYIGKFINFSSPINFFVGVLESVAELAKIISFSFRLFGNMLAGEILLLVMTFMISLASPFLVIFYGLEVFVGAIQAFVFGALTLVFAMGAIASHDDHGHDEEAAHH